MTTERHGDYAGYMRHYRAGEEACDPCRQAARKYADEKRAAELDEENIELGAGEWRPDKRGIQRWHPATVVLHRVENVRDEAMRIRGALAERGAA